MAPKGKAGKTKKREADTHTDEVEAPVTKSRAAGKAKSDVSKKPGPASKKVKSADSSEQLDKVSSSSENSKEVVSDSKATSSKASKVSTSKKRGRQPKESQEQEADSNGTVKHNISDDESDEIEETSEEDVPSPPKKRGRQAGNKSSVEPPSKKPDISKGKDLKPKLNKATSDFEDINFDSAAETKDGKSWNFKISSWNVAGLKAWIKKDGLDFLKHEKPDILCLQETKCSEKKLPPEAKVSGYHTYWLSGEKEGYAGVGLLSKEKPISIKYGIGKQDFDCDGRLITAEFEKFYLVTVYVPNAGQKLKTLPRRMDWDPLFRAHLKKLDEKKPVILCGDLNVAHNEIDLKNPKTNTKSAGFTQEERDGFTALLKEGFVDTFRHLYPDKEGAYTFWTYFSNARAKNTGWRLDYFVLSERLLPSVCDNVIRNDVYGSDHCPITLFVHI